RNPLTLFGRAWDAGFARVAVGYRHVLHFAIWRWARWLVVALGMAWLVGGIMLVATGVLSTEFMPEADNGQMQVNLEMPAGTTLDVTNPATTKVEQRLLALPEVKQVFTSVGVASSGGFGTSR